MISSRYRAGTDVVGVRLTSRAEGVAESESGS